MNTVLQQTVGGVWTLRRLQHVARDQRRDAWAGLYSWVLLGGYCDRTPGSVDIIGRWVIAAVGGIPVSIARPIPHVFGAGPGTTFHPSSQRRCSSRNTLGFSPVGPDHPRIPDCRAKNALAHGGHGVAWSDSAWTWWRQTPMMTGLLSHRGELGIPGTVARRTAMSLPKTREPRI